MDAASGTMEDFQWLWKFGPGFVIAGDNVTVLHEPSQFYEHLKKLSASANKRIVLASLYLGNGELEKDLVQQQTEQTIVRESKPRGEAKLGSFKLKKVRSKWSCMANAVSELHAAAKRNVEVRVLLDYTRGSRGEVNSRTLLMPMLREFGAHRGRASGNEPALGQVQVALYHSPRLRGLVRWLLPERWNETLGLSHLKVYLFDDTLILSGANLSDQYFRNRQDRYVVFRNCPQLANYFEHVVQTVSSFSLQLQGDNSVTVHPGFNIHPFRGDRKAFVAAANKRLSDLIRPSGEAPPTSKQSATDTWVFPLLQMAPLGITQDQEVTERLLAHAPAQSTLRLATGYFNLTEQYSNVILNNHNSHFDLLVASPKVNGFYGAEGISGVIPTVYTLLLRQFFLRVGPKQQEHVQVGEYERPHWTFHGKGLWLWRHGQPHPCLSLVGSPNFGFRSVHQDLEAQVAIVTTNEKLQRQLNQEQQRLYELAAPVSLATFQNPSRHVPIWVRLLTPLLRPLF